MYIRKVQKRYLKRLSLVSFHNFFRSLSLLDWSRILHYAFVSTVHQYAYETFTPKICSIILTTNKIRIIYKYNIFVRVGRSVRTRKPCGFRPLLRQYPTMQMNSFELRSTVSMVTLADRMTQVRRFNCVVCWEIVCQNRTISFK